MAKLPRVLGLLLCEKMDVDPRVGKASLVGIFHGLRFRAFPTPAQSFTVYAALYGGRGEGTMELGCTRLENEQDIYRYRKWTAFPGPGQPSTVEIKVTRCVFPAPGR
jgi:hypothetical protein